MHHGEPRRHIRFRDGRIAFDEVEDERDRFNFHFYCCMPHCDYKTRVKAFNKCPRCGASFSCRVHKGDFNAQERKIVLDRFKPLDSKLLSGRY